ASRRTTSTAWVMAGCCPKTWPSVFRLTAPSTRSIADPRFWLRRQFARRLTTNLCRTTVNGRVGWFPTSLLGGVSMLPAPFEYRAPKTMDEALGLLDELGEDAKILAGGQSLIPLLKLRFA